MRLYYHPLSPIARRVWLALLEKEILFEPILVDLKARENLTPEYLDLNPFHHVPTLVDGDVRILESFAILDYLEAKFPTPSLSPKDADAIAQMRMVQMVIANELVPKLPQLVLLETQSSPEEAMQRHIDTVLRFLAEQLGHADYFGGTTLSLADITAGAALPLTVRLGLSLQDYPTLATWCDRIVSRPAWQQTDPAPAALTTWKRWISAMVKRKQRQLAR